MSATVKVLLTCDRCGKTADTHGVMEGGDINAVIEEPWFYRRDKNGLMAHYCSLKCVKAGGWDYGLQYGRDGTSTSWVWAKDE